MPRGIASLLAALALTACAAKGPRAPQTPAKSPTGVRSAEHLAKPTTGVDIWGLRFVGMDDGPVPPFRVKTTAKQVVDSSTLVGEHPFVIVFFATWCSACAPKLEVLKRAVAPFSDIPVIAVSVDDDSTWRNVPSYVQGHGLHFPVVSGLEHPDFTISYNPFSTVPLVVVVGRNGGLVDYQLGDDAKDDQRLGKSLELARTIGPLAQHPRTD